MKKLPFYFYLVIWITSAALANFFLKADLLLLRTLFATIFFLLPTKQTLDLKVQSTSQHSSQNYVVSMYFRVLTTYLGILLPIHLKIPL